MDTLVISCMDPRLNEYLDEKYIRNKKYGKVEIWRNAGGRVTTDRKLIEYILKNKAKRVILAPHTDCKAKLHIYEALEKGIKNTANDEIVDEAIGFLGGAEFRNREECDKLLDTKEQAYLKERLERARIDVELDVVDISKLSLPKHDGEGKLVISSIMDVESKKLAEKAGVELPSCYIIQGPNLKGLHADIELALSLGIQKVSRVGEQNFE